MDNIFVERLWRGIKKTMISIRSFRSHADQIGAKRRWALSV